MPFFGPNPSPQQKQVFGLGYGNANSIFQDASQGYGNLLANPGYTPQQQAQLYSASLQPISSAYGSAQNDIARTAARTRNDAGVSSNMDAAARNAAGAVGGASAKVASQIANRPDQIQLEALKGLTGLYGPSLEAATDVANKPTQPSIASNIGTVAGWFGA